MATTPTALSRSTIIQKVWENIYDRLKDNVATVTITGSTNVTIQTYTNSFPTGVVDSKSDYPILIVNSPQISWERQTLNKKRCEGSFSVDIYTTQSESCDKFIDAIVESIESYRDDLKGVKMYNVNLESTDKDQAQRGAFNVHMATCTFNFKYLFTETNIGA